MVQMAIGVLVVVLFVLYVLTVLLTVGVLGSLTVLSVLVAVVVTVGVPPLLFLCVHQVVPMRLQCAGSHWYSPTIHSFLDL
tara:strand:- start:6 stop:248 length:243 start_codon:yes stop_codon:yes gene_type:complete